MLSIIGIILSLLMMMYFAYKGVSILLLAPALALFAVLLSGDISQLFGVYTQIFMSGLGSYVMKYFPLFLFGAVFGKLMEDSGSAQSIARSLVKKLNGNNALLAVVLTCSILTYGGVSLFVVGFAIFPIAAAIFRTAHIPKRLIPGAISLGSLSFTMTALPGTPAIQNMIPMPFFGTNAFAAPGLGVIGSVVMFVAGYGWLNYRVRKARVAAERYGNDDDTPEKNSHSQEEIRLPALWQALLPIFLVIACNYVLGNVIPLMNTEYLSEARYGQTKLNNVLGLWAIIGALVISCLSIIVLNWPRWKNLTDTLNKGTVGALLPIFNTASEVGYGAVIASLAAFSVISNFLLNMSAGNVLISESIVISMLVGSTGSASGGLSIALNMMGDHFLQLADASGIAPELLHRVAAMASGGLDTLPHNGAVISLLAICGLTHKRAYLDIFMVTLLGGLLGLVVVIILGSLFGAF
ncbi:GntP family permease [Xenorhabdus littoralis]|uniref:GntP family permease n=1 Tax=Xenorhabdus littoralis TaxID=2582835 RepID=UPI0029E7CB4B|nr:GntP family permease [Xenorhabdus sp. psl]MDX7992423.1 GntP family permease [Xenorhabdus sp. psl]